MEYQIVVKYQLARRYGLLPVKYLACESTNHTECYGTLWECERCGRTMCCNEGMPDDGYFELCDDCWAVVTGRTEQPT